MARLAKIAVFPIKSFDPVWLETAPLTSAGRFANDRAYVLVKTDGRYITGKEHPGVHRIRAEYNLGEQTITLNRARTFSLLNDREKLESWFTESLGQPVTLKHDPVRGFFDDEDAFGPTIISTATVETVAAWFNLSADEIRLRFRTNLEIDGVPAFWEERLYGPAGEVRKFRIGEVEFQGTNPCARCSVPKRNPLTGEPLNDFQRIFMEQRKATLPEWAEESRFDHYYRLAVNTRVSLGSPLTKVKLGDVLKLPD